MKRVYIIITFFILNGCYGLKLAEQTEDPNNPNRGPILIKAGELEYPHLAWKVSIEGTVNVIIEIDTSGIVRDVRIASRKFNADAVYTSAGKIVDVKDIVDEPTIAFYKQCKYLPALRDGKPISITIQTGMNYKLIK